MEEHTTKDQLKTVVIAGANGFIGGKLIERLSNSYEIITLTRRPLKHALISDSLIWDGKNQGDWSEKLNGVFAVINLSGKSVDCRFTDSNKKAILDSRVHSTRAISEAIRTLKNPPSVWLNASGVSIYKETWNDPQDEESIDIADDFLATVTQKWEEACLNETTEVRKVVMRTAVVLDSKLGSFPLIRRLANMYLGGKQGNGKQYFSWIHIEDYCSIVESVLLKDASINGPVNMTAPEAITNSDFMKSVRNSLGKKVGLPAPEFLLKIGGWILGTEPSLVLKSSCVNPKVLLDKKFQFAYPTVSLALIALTERKKY